MKTIYETAVEKWGHEAQFNQTKEELAELIQALCKYEKYKTPEWRENVIEEIFDVQVMIEQIKVMLNISPDEMNNMTLQKMPKLEKAVGWQ